MTKAGGSEFGRTWWGRAWVDALEHRARLGNRLPRGRTYARHSRVDRLRVERGHIHARVFGTRPTPYSVMVRVRVFDDARWTEVTATIAARAAHLAALIDGDLPPEVADLLLPGPGDLGFSCTCPDSADPCKHAAAVCYLAAGVLDSDPFALLLLRGRSREEVLASIREARTERVGTEPATMAARALIGWSPEPLPPPLPPPDHAVEAPQVSELGLAELAADAARRAHGVLARGEASGHGLDRRADLARRAAGADDHRLAALARTSGTRIDRLTQLATAWQLAGEVGLAVIDDPAATDPEALEPARAAIADLGPRARARVRTDGVYTSTGVVLRLGPDRRWYRLERRDRTWDLVAPPAEDPADLLTPADLPPLRDRLSPPPRLR